MRLAVAVLTLFLMVPTLSQALQLTLPNSARQTAGEDLGLDSYALPLGPFADGDVPARTFEGFVMRQAWRIEGRGVTTLQVLRPLREELGAKGYTVLFECAARDCGGFDFRFSTDVIPAPDMLVDLDEYRFLSALLGPKEAPTEAVSLLVSRSGDAIFLQVIRVSVDEASRIEMDRGATLEGSRPVEETETGPIPETVHDPDQQADLTETMRDLGHVILRDLEFDTGSADLGEGPFKSLADLADLLRADPESRIALVGHTDATGGLQGNIILSKRRAESVRARLIETYAVTGDQVIAEGVGFLSPVASNASDEGRKANRRVEAVLLTAQ